MKKNVFLLILVCHIQALFGQDIKPTVQQAVEIDCGRLNYKYSKEIVILDDTNYLHINLKLFNKAIVDTAIVYMQNWNFCFYPGSNDVAIEGRNYLEKEALFFFFKAGQRTPENLILLSDKHHLDRTENHWRVNHYDPTGESGGVQGDCNEFCFASDFRKLCGKDTLEVDFWLSDSRTVVTSPEYERVYPYPVNFVTTSPADELVHPRIFTIDPQLEGFSSGIRKRIPIFTAKDLHITIKNPTAVFKKGYYCGHLYQYNYNESPIDCEQKYPLCREKPCLK